MQMNKTTTNMNNKPKCHSIILLSAVFVASFISNICNYEITCNHDDSIFANHFQNYIVPNLRHWPRFLCNLNKTQHVLNLLQSRRHTCYAAQIRLCVGMICKTFEIERFTWIYIGISQYSWQRLYFLALWCCICF